MGCYSSFQHQVAGYQAAGSSDDNRKDNQASSLTAEGALALP